MTHITRKRHLWTITSLLAVCLSVISLLIFLQYETRQNVYIAAPDNIALQNSTTTPHFLQGHEIFVITGSSSDMMLPVEQILFQYVEIKNSCGVHFTGECVVARRGPGIDFPVVATLRNEVVLRVGGKVTRDGHVWYKVIFDEFVRYPERIPGGMYVAADNVNVLLDEGEKTTWDDGSTTTTKRIIVNRATQTLYAYEGDTLFMETLISTGLELSPTAAGTFTIFKKTPSRYMQGPLPGFTDTYDLPGVPWNLYFTQDGAIIHGTYWHDSFGTPYSHGCVNLTPSDARKLYNWAPLGTKVTVQ